MKLSRWNRKGNTKFPRKTSPSTRLVSRVLYKNASARKEGRERNERKQRKKKKKKILILNQRNPEPSFSLNLVRIHSSAWGKRDGVPSSKLIVENNRQGGGKMRAFLPRRHALLNKIKKLGRIYPFLSIHGDGTRVK